jgi:hypothetical protein
MSPTRVLPVVEPAKSIAYYGGGVIKPVTSHTTNARGEGLVSNIRWMARSDRNRRRFHIAIDFHLAEPGLRLESLESPHSIA